MTAQGRAEGQARPALLAAAPNDVTPQLQRNYVSPWQLRPRELQRIKVIENAVEGRSTVTTNHMRTTAAVRVHANPPRVLGWRSLLALLLCLIAAASPTDLSRVRPGLPAPEFRLPTGDGRAFSLADFRGRNVVLVFYRGHW
jgi:hypothetical protein